MALFYSSAMLGWVLLISVTLSRDANVLRTACLTWCVPVHVMCCRRRRRRRRGCRTKQSRRIDHLKSDSHDDDGDNDDDYDAFAVVFWLSCCDSESFRLRTSPPLDASIELYVWKINGASIILVICMTDARAQHTAAAAAECSRVCVQRLCIFFYLYSLLLFDMLHWTLTSDVVILILNKVQDVNLTAIEHWSYLYVDDSRSESWHRT